MGYSPTPGSDGQLLTGAGVGMQLDVATLKTSRHVSIGQLDVKGIIAAGFAVVGHVNHISALESTSMAKLRTNPS